MTTETLDQTAARESREACQHPGKFEGCAPWVAYYWGIALSGFADRDDGRTYGFDITAEDRERFPELPKRRRTVRLRETDSGFVAEC